MNWLKAAFRAAWENLKASGKRVGTFFAGCAHNATKRWWVLPLSAGATVAVALIHPMFAAGMVALVVNDPGAHPLWRAALDIAAVGLAAALITFLPILALPLAALPVADVMNRFIDLTIHHYKELEHEAQAASSSASQGQSRGPTVSLADGGQG